MVDLKQGGGGPKSECSRAGVESGVSRAGCLRVGGSRAEASQHEIKSGDLRAGNHERTIKSGKSKRGIREQGTGFLKKGVDLAGLVGKN